MKLLVSALVVLVVACGSSGVQTVKTLPPATCTLLAGKVAGGSKFRPPFDGTLYENLTEFFTTAATTDAIVYLKADVSDTLVDQVRDAVEADARIESYVYLDHAAAHAEFESIFSDRPEIVKSLPEEETPTSFKLRLRDRTKTDEIKDSFAGRPGVQEVIGISDSVTHDRARQMLDLTPKLRDVRASGATKALVQLVEAEQRLADQLDKDPNRQIVGENGVFSEHDKEQLEQSARELEAEVARDCPGMFSS